MTHRLTPNVWALLALLTWSQTYCWAELIVQSQFNPAEVGQIVGLAFDQTTDSVWVYGASNASLHQYSRTGTLLSSIARPGEAANDFDLDVAPIALTLNGIGISAGTLLVGNGETGTADIYAVDKSTGTVIATLITNFGASHVVGTSFNAATNSFFMVQDRVPAAEASRNLVAEVDPGNGNVLSSFYTTDVSANFTINFGDIEAAANGHLFIVSSDESSIMETTIGGSLIQLHALPTGVSSLSGIALDEVRGEAWVASTNGNIYRLGGLTAVPEPSSAALVAISGLSLILRRRRVMSRSSNEIHHR